MFSVVRTVTNGDNDDEPAQRQSYARVKRLDYDGETDSLFAVFFSKTCALSGDGVSKLTAFEVGVSSPDVLPTRVEAVKYPQENNVSPMVTTATRDG